MRFDTPYIARRVVGGKPHLITISPMIFIRTLMTVASLAFFVGTASRHVLLNQMEALSNEPWSTTIFRAAMEENGSRDGTVCLLPTPMSNGEDVPSSPLHGVRYLDGAGQPRSPYGEAVPHETLVHPAMFAHRDPRRVAIIGGGEGATLREILKHKTVDSVTLVENEEGIVKLFKEHLPERSDCTDMEGSDAASCFDDSRASVKYVDAFGWFIDSFGNGEEIKEEKFDVLVMDALVPDVFVAIVGSRYTDKTFIDALYNGLSDEGVFVVRFGKADQLNDPASNVGSEADRANMMDALENARFKSMHIYGDHLHSHFDAPWSYLACFKSYTSRTSWYRTAPELDIEMHQRLYRMKSGRPTLINFDAPTMMGYQLPSRAQETAHCCREDKAIECEGLLGMDPRVVAVPASHMKAQKSVIGEYAGRGLFAAQDIPKETVLGYNGSVKAFHMLPSTASVMINFNAWAEDHNYQFLELSMLYNFVEGYGVGYTVLGKLHYVIDSGIALFSNHGCNGTYNVGVPGTVHTEMSVDLQHAVGDAVDHDLIFSPFVERHIRQTLIQDTTLRDIKEGEEILSNYLDFIGDSEYWEQEVMAQRAVCAGAMGEIAVNELD